MYIARIDMDILRSKEVRALENAYKEKFGEWFIGFNYADFLAEDGKCAAQVYKETLKKALQDDKPYQIKSKWYEFLENWE